MVGTLTPGLNSDRVDLPEFGMIPVEMLSVMWPGVLELLHEKGAQWFEIVSETEIYQGLCTMQLDLWCAMQHRVLDGVVVCQWERHSRGSYYHVSYLAGRHIHKYLPIALKQLEHYACLAGAKELVMEGRLGLKRLLAPYGYHSNTVRMRKSVQTLWSH